MSIPSSPPRPAPAVDFPRADTETIEAAGDGLEAFNALFLARGLGRRAAARAAHPGTRQSHARRIRSAGRLPHRHAPAAGRGGHSGEDRGQRRHGGMRAEAHALARGGGGSRQPAGIRPARRSHHDQPRLRARHRERAHRQAARHQRRDQHLRQGQPGQRLHRQGPAPHHQQRGRKPARHHRHVHPRPAGRFRHVSGRERRRQPMAVLSHRIRLPARAERGDRGCGGGVLRHHGHRLQPP